MEVIIMFLVLVIGFIGPGPGLRPLRCGLAGPDCPIPTPGKTDVRPSGGHLNSYYAMLALDLANDRSREARGAAAGATRSRGPGTRAGNTTGSPSPIRLRPPPRARPRDRRDQPRRRSRDPSARRQRGRRPRSHARRRRLIPATTSPARQSACPSRQALFDSWRRPTDGSAWPNVTAMTLTAVDVDRRGLVGTRPDRPLHRAPTIGRSSHRSFDGRPLVRADSLGGRLASCPRRTAWGVDELQVFAIFDDGQLWNRYWDGTSWHDWESLGGELTGTPAASSWSADRIDVFAPGRDGRVWHRWWDGTRWVDWEQLSAPISRS